MVDRDKQEFVPVIGLEVHAELQTSSKMFCSCPVVDVTVAKPNTAVCPICTGMPGVLPVINKRAVDFALMVAIALDCEIQEISIFARKNYFYPDLPKGYQISQYEQPLAINGKLKIVTSQGERIIRIRRVHIEEDTGRLTHRKDEEGSYSLVDLNRAGVPLLEIVSEPDLHSAEEVREYATTLRSLLRYLEVNSGDMQKGVMRIEPNISVHRLSETKFGTRTEIKNLNSFRALEHSVEFEIKRQTDLLRKGLVVRQETRGWDEKTQETFTQRVKEEAEDYRYFPEPDLPPLVVNRGWREKVSNQLPELPMAKVQRYQIQYGLNLYDAGVLTSEKKVAEYFEETVNATPEITPKVIANWISGDLFGLLNQSNRLIEDCPVKPKALAELISFISSGEINKNSAKSVLGEMFVSGKSAESIIAKHGLKQISDSQLIGELIDQLFLDNPQLIQSYQDGNQKVAGWFVGQIMQATKGQADPKVVNQELEKRFKDLIERDVP
jgi:aspartyl-tRNA(Asn)/glutamyl-tRNA(Gln) amidotransferase subunit B